MRKGIRSTIIFSMLYLVGIVVSENVPIPWKFFIGWMFASFYYIIKE